MRAKQVNSINVTFQSKIFAKMNPLISNIQRMAFPRPPMPFILVEIMVLLRNSEPKCKNPVFFMQVFTVFDKIVNKKWPIC